MLCISFRLATPLLQPGSILSVHFLTHPHACDDGSILNIEENAEKMQPKISSVVSCCHGCWRELQPGILKRNRRKKNTQNQDNMQNLHQSLRRDLNAGPCGCASRLISAPTFLSVQRSLCVFLTVHTVRKITILFSRFVWGFFASCLCSGHHSVSATLRPGTGPTPRSYLKLLGVSASGPKNSTDILIDVVPRMRRRRIWSANTDQGWDLAAWILLRKHKTGSCDS